MCPKCRDDGIRACRGWGNAHRGGGADQRHGGNEPGPRPLESVPALERRAPIFMHTPASDILKTQRALVWGQALASSKPLLCDEEQYS
jgi:hypothetical protein